MSNLKINGLSDLLSELQEAIENKNKRVIDSIQYTLDIVYGIKIQLLDNGYRKLN